MTNYNLLCQKVIEFGMEPKIAKGYAIKFQIAEESFPINDISKKEWALRRGFYPGHIDLFGLDESNWKNYVPYYQYFMIHPINNHFKVWLGDKLTCKYVLNSNGCETTMPDYYAYVENDGSYTYLMNCPNEKTIPRNQDFLLNLLKWKGFLAMKPNSGTSGGFGFIKLEMKDGMIYENNQPIEISRFNEIRDNVRNYIITDYIHQHSELAKIWSESECTLRVTMFKRVKRNLYSNAEWQCLVSYARFGTSLSGVTSNLTPGGVGVSFDFETGIFSDYAVQLKRHAANGQWKQKVHPDTKMPWKGNRLPNWQLVKEKIYNVCEQISSLDYLGFDIIITEDSMKLCEINTHPALDIEQIICSPANLIEEARLFFESKGINTFDCDKLWQAYLECQY